MNDIEINSVMDGRSPIPGYGFRVNPEYRDLIPRPTPDEISELRSSLLREGCRDALVVGPSNCLLDGHNRLRICLENSFEFPVDEVADLADENAEKLWILRNQIGRRNLSKSQLAMLAGRATALIAAEREAAEARMKSGENQYSPPVKVPEGTKGDTRDKVGAQFGISGKSVDCARKVLESSNDELISAVSNGDLSVHEAARIAAGPKSTTPKKIAAVDGRKNPAPPKPGKRAEVQRAAGQRRLVLALSQLSAICEVVTDIDLEFICANWHQVSQWSALAMQSAKTIRSFAKRIEEQKRLYEHSEENNETASGAS